MPRRLSLLLVVLALFCLGSGRVVDEDELEDFKLSRDMTLAARLDQMVERIRAAAGFEKELKYALIQGAEVNAVALPNQIVVVTEGAMSLPEAQLYFLLGHELTHLARGHHAAQGRHNFFLGLGLNLLGAALTRGTMNADTARAIAGVEQFACGQFSQAHEQDADREAAALLARLGIDPVYSIVYFKAMGPPAERKDIFGTHPTFRARIDDMIRFLPECAYQPAAPASTKSFLAPPPRYAAHGAFQGGAFDGQLSYELYRYLEGSWSGLVFDGVACQALQYQIAQPLVEETNPAYVLKVKHYAPGVSTTVIEGDTVKALADTLASGQALRAYCVAAARDAHGNRQVGLLCLRM